MTDERGSDGELLPDEKRLPKFGAMLRSTSLDELPEVFCILRGTMSVIGPRPQLVRDMVFMSNEQRMRHTAKPGLTGLAQVKGRNAVTWEEKLDWDLKYIEKVSFLGDVKILFETVAVVFKRSGITDGENATALDYGDALLRAEKITQAKYDAEMAHARNLIKEHEKN
jgi:lipopolysaccharide/colanic/teichoic acid biosynthesis glycosyltransferase